VAAVDIITSHATQNVRQPQLAGNSLTYSDDWDSGESQPVKASIDLSRLTYINLTEANATIMLSLGAETYELKAASHSEAENWAQSLKALLPDTSAALAKIQELEAQLKQRDGMEEVAEAATKAEEQLRREAEAHAAKLAASEHEQKRQQALLEAEEVRRQRAEEVAAAAKEAADKLATELNEMRRNLQEQQRINEQQRIIEQQRVGDGQILTASDLQHISDREEGGGGVTKVASARRKQGGHPFRSAIGLRRFKRECTCTNVSLLVGSSRMHPILKHSFGGRLTRRTRRLRKQQRRQQQW
jgi:flagellar biosynthesis GTPase FlhF